MPNFKFICEHRDYHTDELDSKTTLETNKENLYDVIEEFERFLKGAGFVIDGQLDIVKDENEDSYATFQINDLTMSDQDLFAYPTMDSMNYSAGDIDISLSDVVIGNLDYLNNIDFRFEPSQGNSEFDIKIDTTPSTAWPFPQNERP